MRFWSKVLNVFAPSHARPERRHDGKRKRYDRLRTQLDLTFGSCACGHPGRFHYDGFCFYPVGPQMTDCGCHAYRATPQGSTEPSSALSDEQEFTK